MEVQHIIIIIVIFSSIFETSSSATRQQHHCNIFRYTAVVGDFCRFVDGLRMHKKCRETEVKKG